MTGLEDAIHKFKRGENLLFDFYKNILKTLREDIDVLEIKTQPQEKPARDPRKFWNRYTLYIVNLPVISKEDGILLGEIIQSFRISLDYLAWALVAKHNKRSLTQKEKRKIQFPMARNHRDFKTNIGKWLLNVPPEQGAFFERYQPYRRSTYGREIRCLKMLSNTDKHQKQTETVMGIYQ